MCHAQNANGAGTMKVIEWARRPSDEQRSLIFLASIEWGPEQKPDRSPATNPDRSFARNRDTCQKIIQVLIQNHRAKVHKGCAVMKLSSGHLAWVIVTDKGRGCVKTHDSGRIFLLISEAMSRTTYPSPWQRQFFSAMRARLDLIYGKQSR